MMSNPLYGQFGGQQTNPIQQLVTNARQLKQTIQNPRAEVERLLQSGQMSVLPLISRPLFPKSTSRPTAWPTALTV